MHSSKKSESINICVGCWRYEWNGMRYIAQVIE